MVLVTSSGGLFTSVSSNEVARRGCISFNFRRKVSTGLRRAFGGTGYRGGVELLRVIVEAERSLSDMPSTELSTTLAGDAALELRLDARVCMKLSLGAELDSGDKAGPAKGDRISEVFEE